MISTKIGKKPAFQKLYMLQKNGKNCIENKRDNQGQTRSQVNTLTIVYLIVLDVSKETDFSPLSGNEMQSFIVFYIVSFGVFSLTKRPMSSTVSIQLVDTKDSKRIKRLVLQMTKFIPCEKKKIHEVETEMKGNHYLYFFIDIQ